jgi:putative transport protein
MEIDIIDLMQNNDMLMLFTVIGLGYLIGNLKIGSIAIGPTVGVLLTALVFGHYGMKISPAVGTFGFALFIFSVGLEAGPSFFSTFREDALKYISLAIIVALCGFVMSLVAAKLLSFEPGFSAGLLAGALTSTPTLVGAQEAVNAGLAHIPEGMTAENVINNISVGYSLTYLVGSILVILVISYAPRLMKLNLEAMALTYAREKGILANAQGGATTADTLPLVRAYRVGEAGAGKTLAQRRAELNIPSLALRVKRGIELLDANPELVLEKGDIISFIASLSVHKWARENIGAEEVLDADLLDYRITSNEIVVLDSKHVGKHLSELALASNYGCFTTELVRAGIELPLTDAVILQKGDRLRIIGDKERMRELGELLGYIEEEVEETDLVTFSFGMVLGIFLGLIVINIAGVSIGLGSAGGLLIAGISIGYLSSINPTFGRVPAPARFILKELGLMLLMASIGLNAGSEIIEGLTTIGPSIMLFAVLITVVPLSIGYLFGRRVLRMNPVLLLGSLTGAMTSTPALSIVSKAARSSVPAIGYAGSYTFANVLLTFAGTIMMMLT